MSQEVSDKVRLGPTKSLRNQQIIALTAAGFTQQQIADKLGIHRSTVSEVINSSVTKEIVEEGKARLRGMVDEALQTLLDCMKQRDSAEPQYGPALQSALTVLKNLGIVRDKIDLNHSFPKPTIIERHDGTQVVLGVDEEGNE